MQATRCGLWAALLAAALVAPSSAHTEIYDFILNGPSEAPPNASPATGTARVTLDLDLVTMRVEASFSGLTGNTTAAHIHCCTAIPGTGTVGVATTTPSFVGFPAGVTAGSYDHTYDLTLASSYNAVFVTANGGTVSGALNALTAGLASGRAYFNIHTSTFGGGEIRGFGTLQVPEPASAGLLGLSAVGLLTRSRRRGAC